MEPKLETFLAILANDQLFMAFTIGLFPFLTFIEINLTMSAFKDLFPIRTAFPRVFSELITAGATHKIVWNWLVQGDPPFTVYFLRFELRYANSITSHLFTVSLCLSHLITI